MSADNPPVSSSFTATLKPPTFKPDSKLPPPIAAVVAAAPVPPESFLLTPGHLKKPPVRLPNTLTPPPFVPDPNLLKETATAMEDIDLRPSRVPAIAGHDAETLTKIKAEPVSDARAEVTAEVAALVEPPQAIQSERAPAEAEVNKKTPVNNEIKDIVAPLPATWDSPWVAINNSHRLDARPLPTPAISWWDRAKKTVSGAFSDAKASVSKLYNEVKNSVVNLYKSATDWVLPKLRKVVKPLVAAAGLAAFLGLGVNAFNGPTTKKNELVDATSSTSSMTAATPNVVRSAVVKAAPTVNQSSVDLTPTTDIKVPAVAPATTPEVDSKFTNILANSKSPLVQQIIKDGKLTIGTQSITDAMIGSMKGLTNAAQKLQVVELEKQINVGLGVYFNEYFGTPAKVAESLKNPDLKNLYRTAKYAQEKGWSTGYHSKERFPQAYLLAKQLLGDSHELGHDASDNPDPQVKASVQGNMFQAKLPGSTINLKKANGNYHVVTELMIGILEGKQVKDMMKTGFAADSAADKGTNGLDGTPTSAANEVPVGQPANASGMDAKNSNQHGMILPNIIGRQDVGVVGLTDEIDRGWDELIEKADQKAVDKKDFESRGMVEFDLPLSMTTRQENEAILPTLIEKVVALNPQADAEAIRKLMRRYGFAGVKSLVRGKPGHFKVEMQPGVLKMLSGTKRW